MSRAGSHAVASPGQIAPDPQVGNWWTHSRSALLLTINAALCVCALECVHYLLTAKFQLRALSYIPLSLITLAVGLGFGLAALLGALQAVDRFAQTTRLSLLLSWCGLIAPQVYVTWRVFSFKTLGGWLSLAVLIGLAALGGRAVAHLRLARWPWVACTLGSAAASIHVLGVSFSLDKAAAGTMGLDFFYVHTIPLLSIAAASSAYLILRHCQGRPVPRMLAACAGLLGFAVCYLVLPRLPINSAATVGYLRLICTLLVVLGATRLPMVRHVRAALPLGAVAVALHLYVSTSSSTAPEAGWSLSRNTVLAAAAAQNTGMLRAAGRDRESRLKSQPEYERGLGVLDAAKDWNQARSVGGERAYSVLLITVDALRYDAVQYSGQSAEDYTPNINRLAPLCHRFHRAYAQGGWTSISLPALLWSKYPRLIDFVPLYEDNEQGLHWQNQAPQGLWIEKRFQSPIREPDPNLAQVLSEHGLRTIAITNDEFTGYFTPELGFTRHFQDIPYPKQARARRRDPVRRAANLDEVTADIAIGRLTGLGDQRFFIWTHLFSPHGPYEPPEGYKIPFTRYHGEIFFADLQVGRILDHLQRLGRARDTIVVISADHGESFFEHHNNTHGKELYDHAMRVPLLLCVPGEQPVEVQTPVGLIDIAPTVLDYLGVAIPKTMQGFSLRPLLRGDPSGRTRPPVFLQTWQNEPKSLDRELDRIAIVRGHHKLILDLRWNVFSLFDLSSDPAEKHNLLETKSPDVERRFLRLGGYLLGWRDIQR